MNSPDWRLHSLRNFWQTVNWENRVFDLVPSNSSNTNNGKSSSVLSFLMPVREYFRAFSWTGIPEIAVTSHQAVSNSDSKVDESRETLEDFLDDISNFF